MRISETASSVQTNAVSSLGTLLCSAVCAGLFLVVPALADDPPGDVTDATPIEDIKQVFIDPVDDMALRRTDDDPSVDPLTTNGPELLCATLGRWVPVDAYADPYFGNYSTNGECDTNGEFLRLDMVFDGLFNPPGDLIGYAPTKYGPNPLFGWVELDMDTNAETGGETEEPDLGYNANVARWGGMPQGAWFEDRISIDGEPWSGDFEEIPATHRSGLEFMLLFHGNYMHDIEEYVEGNTNNVFEEGETWIIGGDFFWRAPGYDPITYTLGYRPHVTIRFKHSIVDDATTVSFVYPLDNLAHARLYNDWPAQDNDFTGGNANSVYEALSDLRISADNPWPGPPPWQEHDNWPLLVQWATQDPLDHLNPWDWRCTMLFGTGLEQYPVGGGVHVWTDAWPNVVVNDFNGDGLITKTDRQLLNDYVTAHDGETGYDADGMVNQEIDREAFSNRFSMHDDDYDGLVSTNGFPEQGPCDYDNDGDVDLDDYRAFQVCYSTTALDPEVLVNVGCLDAFDDNNDLDVDLDDYVIFVSVMNGPG